jgi:hypothetical protein
VESLRRRRELERSREKVPAFSYDSSGTLERGTHCHFRGKSTKSRMEQPFVRTLTKVGEASYSIHFSFLFMVKNCIPWDRVLFPTLPSSPFLSYHLSSPVALFSTLPLASIDLNLRI